MRRRPPAHVFWVRRGLVLGVLAALVWGLVGLVGLLDVTADTGTSARASTTAVDAADPAAEQAVEDAARPDRRTRAERRRTEAAVGSNGAAAARPARLPEPSGPCTDSDVVVIPSVPDGHAGGPVTVVLEVSTVRAKACTWQVDAESVFVTITDGSTLLWSSQYCPRALPTTAVVARRETPARVRFTWSGKESSPDCSVATDWVFPGTYQVNAVARGSVTPAESLFALGEPEAAPAPEPRRTRDGGTGAQEEPDEPAEGTDSTDSTEGTDGADAGTRETAAEAAARREKRREALREARAAHREEQRRERREADGDR